MDDPPSKKTNGFSVEDLELTAKIYAASAVEFLNLELESNYDSEDVTPNTEYLKLSHLSVEF